MKLYHAPAACSLGIHILLREAGAEFELAPVNLREKEQYAESFVAMNPKSKVPVLVLDDGTALTQFPAIATWIALNYPKAGLVPQGPDGLPRALEALDYIVSTIHMHGFSRLYHPMKYVGDENNIGFARQMGHDMVAQGFALMAELLRKNGDYLIGTFSIADAALFYVELWATRLGEPLPEECVAHFARMKTRPAVAAALQAEGLGAA